MPPVRDATVGMHLGEPVQRLVDDQPPLTDRADLRCDALERRRGQERIGSGGEVVLLEILAEDGPTRGLGRCRKLRASMHAMRTSGWVSPMLIISVGGGAVEN
jgi:hypothetical protein